MWTYLIIFGSAITLLIIGFVSLRYRLFTIQQKIDFSGEYRKKFLLYCNSDGNDQEAYTWLILKSNRMQDEMGSQGIYSSFSPPGGRYTYKNYPIVLNMLPELRHYIEENRQSMGTIFASTVNSYARMIDEALLRYLGSLEQRFSEATSSLKNPFIWFRAGVEQFLATPLIFLVWVGLMGSAAVWKVRGSHLFKILAGSVTIIGFISGLITIILGWNETVSLVQSTWNGLFK